MALVGRGEVSAVCVVWQSLLARSAPSGDAEGWAAGGARGPGDPEGLAGEGRSGDPGAASSGRGCSPPRPTLGGRWVTKRSLTGFLRITRDQVVGWRFTRGDVF